MLIKDKTLTVTTTVQQKSIDTSRDLHPIQGKLTSSEMQQLHKSITVVQYLSKPLTIESTATCEQLVNIFKQNPASECVVLVDSLNRPVTLFMRNALFMKFSRRYSSDLFFEKPVTVLIDKCPLILELTTPPENVIQAAMDRDIEHRYDCVVIVSANQVLQGVLTLSNILELSSKLQKYAKHEQAVLIEKAAGYVHHIADEMKAVESEIVKQHQYFNSMIDYTLQGKNLLQQILDSFNNIDMNTQLQNKQIMTMKQDSTQLKKIAHNVVELSEQSNILALNATIEAAKAKENGLAFSVVASEVKDLSQKTKGSASHIQQVIQTMVTLIEQNEVTSTNSVSVTNESKFVIDKTEEVFRAIFAALAQQQKEISLVSEQAKHVTALTNKTKQELSVLSGYLN